MNASYQLSSLNESTEMLLNLKLTIMTAFLASAAGMFSGNPEWDVIVACALGGVFGSVIGVFLAIFGPQSEWKWHLYGLRWGVNFCTSIVCGPMLYWWMFGHYFMSQQQPSPILAMACGGVAGALFILLIQPLMPSVQRLLDRKIKTIISTDN